MRRRLTPFTTVVLAATLLQATGCSSWHSSPGLDSAALIRERPSRVRLRLTSGQQVELKRAALRGDSVIGLVKGDTTRVATSAVATRVGITFGLLFGLAALACAADPCGY